MGRTGWFKDQSKVDEVERELFGGHADGSGEMDEDENDEDEQDEYEKDGFVVDDAEEDEGEGRDNDEERQKKKKRKKKEEYLLDEDDYELLEDNNIKIPRQKGGKRFKRLKKARKGLKEESYGYFKEEFVGSSTGFQTAEEKIKQTLFGDDEGSQLEDIGEEDEEPEEELDVGDDDEMADFIVDEEEVEEHGALRRKLKKKRSRYAPEVSLFALQEAHDIFGDVDELLELRKEEMSTGKCREQRIEDGFEPIVVSEKYMTERDDQIRKLDIPERMQLFEETIGPIAVDEISIEAESSWIYSQLESGMIPFFGSPGCGELCINKGDIIRFLNLVHLQRLDIPFIAMYRKEEIPSLLKDPELSDSYENQNRIEKAPSLKWHKLLWSIQHLDKKWLLLQKRKTALQSYYDKRYEKESQLIYDETRLSSNQHLLESIMMSLKLANSEREVDDVDSKFNLHFPPDEEEVDGGQFRRPKRKSHFSVCHKAGLWGVKFSYSSEQFGAQLSLEKMRIDELEDPKEAPEEIASKFMSSMFESPQSALKGARHMAAVEISCEPSVRKYVRSYFKEHAVLSTSPTPDGNVAIDSLHQYAGVKWMKDKPLNKFEDAQWLLIQKAEEEKVLNVTIKLPEKHLSKLVNDFNEYYLSDGVSKSAQLWNEQRKMILKDALFEFLLPLIEKEARITLTLRAKNWLLAEYGKALWDKACVGPYKCKENVIGSDDEAAPRVMACCWGPGKPPTTFVMLDSSGEVLDVLSAGSLSSRSQNVTDLQRKKNDQERVLKFMSLHQPHVVVVGAINLSCTRLKDDIYEIIFKMVEENPREVGHEMDGLSVVYGDETWSRLFENSRISSEQLQGQSGIIKRAVALGRYLQNPLALIGGLCGPGREVLSYKLINLENYLTPDEKYGMVEQVMVDITNQVGLDINLAISHEWLFSTLQFISGLGPRKAAALQRSLVRTGSIYNLRDLVIIHGLGKKVFLNAVGFLRVRRSGLAASSSQCFDILDDTRIHPESYAMALELANDIFVEDTKSNGNRECDPELTIDYVRGQPSLLKTIDVDEYSKSKKCENKKETLYDIIRELVLGFQDRRKQYEEPSQDEEFFMISGETDETMVEGLIVQATVRRVQDEKVICALESGLTGILMKEDYSDGGELFELSDKLHEGDILSCKIKSVQKNRYQVFLACTERYMKSKRHQNPPNLDPYYHEDQSTLLRVKEKTPKEKTLTKRQFKPRMIVHPRFRNLTADEAMAFLSDKGLGECIIRPSSRGPSYLTLTLKVYDGVYAHKDIIEGGKEHKDIASLLRIGKTLKIGEDTFEDLDEVMDRYVDPLVGHLKAMLNYRKFLKGTKAEVDEILRIEKIEYPMRIVYCFGISHEHPGTFILTFIRSSNPHHEYIGLYPKGFKFRKKMFEDMDRLVAYFQKHINDSRQDSGPSIRSAAAMVPLQSRTGKFSTDEGCWGHKSFDRDQSSTPSSGAGPDRGRGRGRGDRGRGRGRGKGRGSYNDAKGNTADNEAFDRAGSSWDAVAKDGDNSWSNFPGAQVENSPGREAFPGGWGSGGSGSGGTSGNDGGGWSSGGNGWGKVGTGGGCDRESGGSGWGVTSGGDSDFGGVRGGGGNNTLGGSEWGKGNGIGSNVGRSWGSGGSGWADGRDNSRQDFVGSGWSGGGSDSSGASRGGPGRARGNDFGSRGFSRHGRRGRGRANDSYVAGRDFGEDSPSGSDGGWRKASSGDNVGWGKAGNSDNGGWGKAGNAGNGDNGGWGEVGGGENDQVSRGSCPGRSSGGDDDNGQMCGGGGWGGASGDNERGLGGGGSSDNGSGWGKPSGGRGRGRGRGRAHGGSGWGSASNDDAGGQGPSGSGWGSGSRGGGSSIDNGSGWGKPKGANNGDAGGQASSGSGWGKATGGSSWSGAGSSHNGRDWGKPTVGSGSSGASDGDAGGQGSGGSDWGKACGNKSGWGAPSVAEGSDGSGWGGATGNDVGTGGRDAGGNGENRGRRVDDRGVGSGGYGWEGANKGTDGQGSSGGWGGASGSGGWGGASKVSDGQESSGWGGASGSASGGWGGASKGGDGQGSSGCVGASGGWGGASKGGDGQGSSGWGGASGGGSSDWGGKKDTNPSKGGSGWSSGGGGEGGGW